MAHEKLFPKDIEVDKEIPKNENILVDKLYEFKGEVSIYMDNSKSELVGVLSGENG